jgi:hypothetical protein
MNALSHVERLASGRLMSSDSGYDLNLYKALAAEGSKILLLDGRSSKGSIEHAGFDELRHLERMEEFAGVSIWVTGYGRQDEVKLEADTDIKYVRPGQVLPLNYCQGKACYK